MTRLVGSVCMALAFCVSLQVVSAQQGDDKKKKGKFDFTGAFFKKLDTDGNNSLNKGEFMKMIDRFAEKIDDKAKVAELRERAEKSFQKHSTDGAMSQDQFAAYMKERFQGSKGKGDGDKKKKRKTDNNN